MTVPKGTQEDVADLLAAAAKYNFKIVPSEEG